MSEQAGGYADLYEHLLAELPRLDLVLRRELLRLQLAGTLSGGEFRGLYIPDSKVQAILGQPAPADPAAEAELDRLEAAIADQTTENRVRLQASEVPLRRLTELFDLSWLEIDIILLALAAEVDQRYETVLAFVQDDVNKKRPTAGLALRLFAGGGRAGLEALDVFSPPHPLRGDGLLRLVPNPQLPETGLLDQFLAVDQPVLDFLLGRDLPDARLRGIARPVVATAELGGLDLSEDLRTALAAAAEADRLGLLYLQGLPGAGASSAAEAIAVHRDRGLVIADARAMVRDGRPPEDLVMILLREARLRRSLVLVDGFDDILQEGGDRSAAGRIADALAGSPDGAIVSGEAAWGLPLPSGGVRFLSFDLGMPDYALRVRVWADALRAVPVSVAGDVNAEDLANKFVLTPGRIRAAVRAAADAVCLHPTAKMELSLSDLRQAAKDQSDHDLGAFAQKLEAHFTWDDLVLPPLVQQQLLEVHAAVQHRQVVYTEWGFGEGITLGRGLNVMFAGPSGTGKTMAALVLANELGLDLYRIDLSTVVSKYIGDIEKNLARVFREAQHMNGIIFFDEADALFGKRSQVTEANDRYANLEVAYLLQRIEEYEGVVILATNLVNDVDDAFARRMHAVIDFPQPAVAQREQIWRKVFPPPAPLAAEVDFARLARRFDLSGGNIRNVALAASFMAADAGGQITMERIVMGVGRELQKLGRLPSRTEFGEFFELVRGAG